MDRSKCSTQQKEGMVADGFSSEQQVYTKQKQKTEEKKDEQNSQDVSKGQLKFVLPPPQQIKSKKYSLLPDKATGWGLKSQQPNPIPITFGNKYLDKLVSRMLQANRQTYPVVYLGPRYQNTFYAWRDKPFKFPYSHINMPKNIKYRKRPFLGQNPEVEDSVGFDSVFEAGNLDLVVKVGSWEYDLFVRVDSNTRGHFNWFNFVVSGLKAGQRYRFNICNLERGFCLYTRGMKPYMKSLRKKGDLWKQAGSNVTYFRKDIRFAKYYDFDPIKQWTLSFELQTDLENDQVQIAYCVPYTYSQMLTVIDQLKEETQRRNILKETRLCVSLGGLPISLLSITQPQKDDQTLKTRKCIILCGRVHPGESNGSFMMEGFLKFICGQSKQAQYLRRHIVFKIVPMLNPDGVVLGNYRTGLSGKDFNREYRNPDKDIFPQVYFFKKLVTELKMTYKDSLFMFLDLHGHSTKKNVFAYGPEFPIAEKFYYQARVFAKMLEKQNKLFRYHSCVFKVSECKLATARAILLRKINIPLTYTIEASNGFYHDRERLVSVPFVAQEWLGMGASIGKSISEYVECMLSSEKVREDREKARKQASHAKREKTKTKSNSVSPVKQKQHPSTKSLVSAKQDQKLKRIYEQILKQQSQALENANSDDNISEGSSDKEDDKDDLSKNQLQTLFKSIKNNNKLGKNKKGKVYKVGLVFDSDKQEDEHMPVIEQHRRTIKVKRAVEVIQRTETVQLSEQVFIGDKFFLNDKNRLSFGPPKYVSERKQRSSNQFSSRQNHSKIINCMFEQEKNNSYLETISIFPSFVSKGHNTIVLTENKGKDSPQKSHRSIVFSNVGSSPRSIKLIKNRDFDKTLNLFDTRNSNSLQKKLEQIGLEKFQTSYSKFTKTNFHIRQETTNPQQSSYPKNTMKNPSFSFSKNDIFQSIESSNKRQTMKLLTKNDKIFSDWITQANFT